MQINDEQRLKFLMNDGYLPEDIRLFVSPLLAAGATYTMILDACLAEGFVPAYWREPYPGEKRSPNGSVLLRYGDRTKIDICIAAGKEKYAEQTASPLAL